MNIIILLLLFPKFLLISPKFVKFPNFQNINIISWCIAMVHFREAQNYEK